MGTHFSQESMLKSSLQLAEKIQLPLILHVTDLKSLERSLEIIRSEFETNGVINEDEDEDEPTGCFDLSIPLIIHDVITCSGADKSIIPNILHPNIYYIVSGNGITDPDADIKQKASDFFKDLPLERVLLATDSPWRTPQNLKDPYLRTLRNESSNIPSIAEAIAEISSCDLNEVVKTIRSTSLRVFNIEFQETGDNTALETLSENLKQTYIAAENAPEIKTSIIESIKEESQPSESTSNLISSESAYYRCTKCRSHLFKANDITKHSLGATKTVFKVGEEGVCTSFVFVGAPDGRDIHKRLGVSIRGGNVECTNCGIKLGKFSAGEAICPCGATVSGPVTKINASKVDYTDDSLNAQELAERSKIENEDALRQQEIEDLELEKKMQDAAARVKKVKKHKSDNKGNFSSFRNKSFLPNASRSKKGKDDDGDDEDFEDNEEEN